MKIGFTGTRRGMTDEQEDTVHDLLSRHRSPLGQPWDIPRPKPNEGHHGDCVGADAQFHAACLDNFIGVVIHPPVDESHRAHCQGAVIVEPKTHFARNRDIVNDTDMLIATPWQMTRPAKGTGGGTWYTIEYAEKQGKRVVIIWPDGRVADSSPASPRERAG